jgi:hypothetical protein
MFIMSSIIAAEWSVQQSNVGDIRRPAPLFRLLRKNKKVDRPQYIKKKVLSSSYLEESFFLFDK